MSSSREYKIDFVRRTKELIENDFENFKSKNREVTFLMNCLLGLIVNVSENTKREKYSIFDKNMEDFDFFDLIPEKIAFFEGSFFEMNENGTPEYNCKRKEDFKKMMMSWFLVKLRNSIAHQNIKALNRDGKWVEVKMWNIKMDGGKDFEIIFEIEQLKNFVIKISEQYIEYYDWIFFKEKISDNGVELYKILKETNFEKKENDHSIEIYIKKILENNNFEEEYLEFMRLNIEKKLFEKIKELEKFVIIEKQKKEKKDEENKRRPNSKDKTFNKKFYEEFEK